MSGHKATHSRLITAALLTLLVVPVCQGQWSSQLESGGQVRVDPQTNRATITRDGVTTQAWDGVHQLSDGTTLTIRAGQAVPNAGILNARRLPPPPVTDQAQVWVDTPIIGDSPCEKLVDQVCGVDNACAESPGCQPARQLLTMEHEERSAAATAGRMTYTSGQCMEAFKDKVYFKVCPGPR